jgi:hypothetical protein
MQMKTQTLLGGLLAAQLVLAGALSLNALHQGGTDTAAPLLDFQTAAVDRVVIDDNAAKSTTLTREGEGWQLGGLDLPANKEKSDSLLETLAGLQTTLPVVSTAAGRERFEVTEEKFQRRLRLYDGDELLGEYFFGTSPGFRRTHGRRAEDDAVYALNFNNFDLPGDSNDWLDKSLLAVKTPQKIRGTDFELSRNGDEWLLAGATEAEQLDTAKINEVVSALEALRVLRADDTMPEGDWIEVGVTSADGEWQYEFLNADGKYYVKRSDQQRAFTISQADYERIAGKSRANLMAAPVAEDPGTTDTPA